MKNTFTVTALLFLLSVSGMLLTGLLQGKRDTPVRSSSAQPTVAPLPSAVYDAAYVKEHNTKADCLLIIEAKVYAVSEYIPFHPGGTSAIVKNCGTDATAVFNTKGVKNQPHSNAARVALAKYYVADLSAPLPSADMEANAAKTTP